MVVGGGGGCGRKNENGETGTKLTDLGRFVEAGPTRPCLFLWKVR